MNFATIILLYWNFNIQQVYKLKWSKSDESDQI